VWPNVVRFDASGIELPQSPKWQVYGNVDYTRSVGSNREFHFGFDTNYKGSTTGGGLGPRNATGSYAVSNIRFGLGSADDKWRVMLWSRNLFDKSYYPAAYQGGNGPWVRSQGMPRTVGVTGEFRF
jgi:iron complex outermembrane receptor protein